MPFDLFEFALSALIALAFSIFRHFRLQPRGTPAGSIILVAPLQIGQIGLVAFGISILYAAKRAFVNTHIVTTRGLWGINQA